MSIPGGIAGKLVIPIASVTVLTCLVMALVATAQVQRSLSAAFASKGEAIALSLAASAEESLGNAPALQAAIDSNKLIAGVGYVYAQDADGTVVAHTFSPAFPPGLEKQNALDVASLSAQHRVQVNPEVRYGGSAGTMRAIDVAAPVAGGALGVVHVGMDRLQIEREVRALQGRMALWGALVALLGVLLGALTAAVVVIRPVRYLIAATQKIAGEGDLTTPIDLASRDELGQLARSFAKMVGRLREALNKLRLSNDTLGSLTEELNHSAGEQTRNATQQAAALQETHVTAQEIKQTSQLAAEKADRVLKDAERADHVSRKGEEALQRTVKGLTDIGAQVGEIGRRVEELSACAQQIAGITLTVKDLADQSNMLALNAAIEAVRSGEHGKGFAVVAREIRALADQSIAATRRVSEVLEEISGAIRRVSSISQQGLARVEAGLEEVKSSGQNLSELSAIVRENSSSARQIAAAVSQQNAGVSQVFSAMQDLTRMMNETMRSIEATSAAAAQLAGVSEGAAEAVRGYRV